MKSLMGKIPIIAVISVFVALSVASARLESLTFDEPMGHNYQIGWEAVWGNFTYDPYNPPFLMELAVIPELLGLKITGGLPADRYFFARMVTSLLGVILIYLVYSETRRRFSRRIGLIAAGILALEPNFLAHSHYITFDTGTAFFYFIFWISFLRLLDKQTLFNYLLAGIGAGLAFSSRIILIPYILMTIITTAVFLKKAFRFVLSEYFGVLIFLTCALFIVWSTYFFSSGLVIAPGNDSGRVSDRIMARAEELKLFPVTGMIRFFKYNHVPMGDYIALIKNNYLRGAKSSVWWFYGSYISGYRWYFMILTFLQKTPLPLIFVFVTGIYRIFSSYKKLHKSLVLIIPVIAIFGVTVFSGTNPYIRYILPVYPFVAVISALGLASLTSRFTKIIGFLLIFWYIWGSLSYFPHFITYANELTGSREKRYLRFTDSNLDWGQGLISLHKYIEARKPGELMFSYFGTDDASEYGFASKTPFGSWRFDDICAFHKVVYPDWTGNPFTVISVSNWWACKYSNLPQFQESGIEGYVAGSFLIFSGYEIQTN